MKKIFSFFVAALLSTAMFAQERVYDTNFALASNGSSATASSGTAANAIDGNNGSRWESASTDTEWFQLDLGQARIFNTIQIRWEGAYTKKFTLATSADGETWALLGDTIDRTLAAPGNYEEQFEFAETTARYIRFQVYKRATGWGNSFYEFRVLLPGVSVLTTLESSIASALCKVGEEDAITVVAKDQNGAVMDAGTLTYVVTPTDAGTVTDGKFVPAKAGSASIVVKAGEVSAAALNVFAYAGDNVIVSNSLAESKIIAQSAVEPNGSDKDAYFAIDNNDGSQWQGRPDSITGGTDAARTYDSWFVADLGAYYDIELVTIKFEGACSQAYTLDFSADNETWANAYTYVGNSGINGHTDMIYPGADKDLQNNNKVRYVRFFSTKAATEYGMKVYYVKVYGTAWTAPADNVKPVMGAASLVSKTHNQAVIAVAATDDNEVKDFHVVDATNSIDVTKSAVEGHITVTGLTQNTAYSFTITARDLALNESENSAVVAVTTDAHYDRPQAAATAPTAPASRVIKVFSDAYTGAEFSAHEAWGDATVYEAMTIGEDNIRLYSNINWLGWAGDALNCLNMEKLHLDIWAEDNGQIGIVPIYGGTALTTDDTHRKVVTLVGQQWNTIDLDLATDFAGLNLASIFQFKFDQAQGAHFAFDNVYFYRTTDLEDTEAPHNLVATLSSASYFSVVLKVAAEDNMGAVTFVVMNGENQVASQAAASGDTTLLTVAGLLPATEYSFSVVAKDANDNASDAVVVAATTLAAPAAAPAPTHAADSVKSIFSDAYQQAPATIKSFNEGWWDQPTLSQAELAADEHVLFYNGRMTGMIGWEFAAFDATGYTRFHIDVYPLGNATNVKFGPTYGGEELTTAVYTFFGDLVANQWNSFDFDLAENDLSSVFQFQMMQYALTNGMFVDNAYFWMPAPTAPVDPTALENVETTEVLKFFREGQLYIMKNGVVYTVMGQVVK